MIKMNIPIKSIGQEYEVIIVLNIMLVSLKRDGEIFPLTPGQSTYPCQNAKLNQFRLLSPWVRVFQISVHLLIIIGISVVGINFNKIGTQFMILLCLANFENYIPT